MEIDGEKAYLNTAEQRIFDLDAVEDATFVAAKAREVKQQLDLRAEEISIAILNACPFEAQRARIQEALLHADRSILSAAIPVILEFEDALTDPKLDLFSVI